MDGWDEKLLDGLEAGELDLAFAFLPLRGGPLAAVELLRDPYVAVARSTRPLPERRSRFRSRRSHGSP